MTVLGSPAMSAHIGKSFQGNIKEDDEKNVGYAGESPIDVETGESNEFIETTILK